MAAEENDAPVEKIGGEWRATNAASGYRLDQDRISEITGRWQDEWKKMKGFMEETDGRCLMTKMRKLLDDTTLMSDDERCRKCGVCCRTQPELIPGFSADSIEKAVQHVKNSTKMFACKSKAPFEISELPSQLPDKLLAAEGQVLSRWGDIGWGSLVQEGKHKGYFSDKLVGAMADMIEKRLRCSTWKNYGWVTCVPSIDSHRKLVPGFAYRVSKRLELPFRRVVVKEKQNQPQKKRKNNFHRCLNLDGAFKIKEQEQYKLYRGSVILIDDVVRSTYTMTVIAALLRKFGSDEVYPFALAQIGSED